MKISEMIHCPGIQILDNSTILVEIFDHMSISQQNDYVQSMVNRYGELGYILDNSQIYQDYQNNRKWLLMKKIEEKGAGKIENKRID